MYYSIVYYSMVVIHNNMRRVVHRGQGADRARKKTAKHLCICISLSLYIYMYIHISLSLYIYIYIYSCTYVFVHPACGPPRLHDNYS